MLRTPSEEELLSHQPLKRVVGVFGATMMGLGSIIGTGVFVSIGMAAVTAGPAVVLAIAIAAVVAVCNGLSSAELAANHPVSGGTYEYGYRWLRPSLGFTAGWMFLCAKSASAATAALGLSRYALSLFGSEGSQWLIPVAVVAVVVLTLLVLSGIRRSSLANIAIVSVTLAALGLFVAAGVPSAWRVGTESLTPFFAPAEPSQSKASGFLEATALMFVAYTGYGRIATLGEEIRDPRRNIPIAIGATLAVSMLLYVCVGLIVVLTLGDRIADLGASGQTAPLEYVARNLSHPIVASVVAIGAMTAMLGVLLNLILGLSRVALAMGRRGDLLPVFSRIDSTGETPYLAVIAIGLLVAALAAIGNIKTTWSFSAFTVLIYYALTNLAAIQLNEEERLYPRMVPWTGLTACLFLAFWVETVIWLAGICLIAIGLIMRTVMGRIGQPPKILQNQE